MESPPQHTQYIRTLKYPIPADPQWHIQLSSPFGMLSVVTYFTEKKTEAEGSHCLRPFGWR